jgi:hypothetical protein
MGISEIANGAWLKLQRIFQSVKRPATPLFQGSRRRRTPSYLTIGITSDLVLAPQETQCGGGGGTTLIHAPTNPTTSPPQIEQLPILCSKAFSFLGSAFQLKIFGQKPEYPFFRKPQIPSILRVIVRNQLV